MLKNTMDLMIVFSEPGGANSDSRGVTQDSAERYMKGEHAYINYFSIWAMQNGTKLWTLWQTNYDFSKMNAEKTGTISRKYAVMQYWVY